MKRKTKNGFFEWPEIVKYTFHTLRETFTQTFFLKHFNPEIPIRLETDVSNYDLDGLLSQFHKNNGQ